MRPPVILTSLVLALAALTLAPSPAAASCTTTGSPHTRVDGVSVETRDGAAWQSGDPVSVVIRMSRVDDDWAFPEDGLAVVMRTDAERTKCLDVPLRKVGGSADQAVYAGVFYPFRAAVYEAKVTVGGEAHDITFVVGTSATDPTVLRNGYASVGRSSAVARDAVAAPADRASSAPVAPLSLDLAGAAAVAVAALVFVALARRRPVALA